MGPAEMRRTRIQQPATADCNLAVGARQPCFIIIIIIIMGCALPCSVLLCGAVCLCCAALRLLFFCQRGSEMDGCSIDVCTWGPEMLTDQHAAAAQLKLPAPSSTNLPPVRDPPPTPGRIGSDRRRLR